MLIIMIEKNVSRETFFSILENEEPDLNHR